MKKIRKLFAALLAAVISSAVLAAAASAETVNIFNGEYYHEDGEKAIAEKITEEQYKNILDAFDLFKLKI